MAQARPNDQPWKVVCLDCGVTVAEGLADTRPTVLEVSCGDASPATDLGVAVQAHLAAGPGRAHRFQLISTGRLTED